MAAEEAQYEVVDRYANFELRRYPPMLVAETEVAGDFDQAGGRAFRILADYIFGNNQGTRKIAMTTPVNQQPVTSHHIAMTAPVSQQLAKPQPEDSGQGRYHVRFMMPAQFTLDTLPRPNDARVHLRQIPERLMAAQRYSGSWAETTYRKHERGLLAAVREAGLTTLGTSIYARYNSPFSLPFLRRNEVLIEVRPAAGDNSR